MPNHGNYISSINFSSISYVGEQFRKLKVDPADFGKAIDLALALSPTKGQRLAKAIVGTISTIAQLENEGPKLINGSLDSGSDHRRILVEAFSAQGANLYLVNQISRMTRKNAEIFMPDYFAGGGDLKSVMEWLQLIGSLLRRNRLKQPDTDGFPIYNEIKDFVESAIETAGEAIESVVHAVGDTVEAMASMAGSVLNWAVDKVSDVVEGLIEAGKSVAEIMEGALAHGIKGIKKFTAALVYTVSRPVAELLVWVADKIEESILTVVSTLKEHLSIGVILEYSTKLVVGIGQYVVKAFFDLGYSITKILDGAAAFADHMIGYTIQTMLDAGRTLGEIVIEIIQKSSSLLNKVLVSISALSKTIADILESIVELGLEALQKGIPALIKAGKKFGEMAQWAVKKGTNILKQTIEIVLDAGYKLAFVISQIAVDALHLMNQVLNTIYESIEEFSNLLKAIGQLAVDIIAKVIEESLKLGKTILTFVGHVLAQSYALASHYIKAAIKAGLKAAELLGNIAQRTYWSIRKVVNGILEALGPIGDVLDWVLTQSEGISDKLWHGAFTAIRYADGKMNDILEWASKKTTDVFTAVVATWESVGEKLIDLYKWAVEKTSQGIWLVIGQVTAKLMNSVSYLVTYLEKDFFKALPDLVKGLVEVTKNITIIVVEFIGHTLETVIVMVQTLFKLSYTLKELLIETALHPQDAMKNLIQASNKIGKTAGDIFEEAYHAGESIVKAVVDAQLALNMSVKDILIASAEIGLGAAGACFSYLLSFWGVHRPLNEKERTGAEAIFGKSIDLDRVLISVLNPPVEVLQLVNGKKKPGSRPFTTNYVLNFASWVKAKTEVVMHELTHVWQSVEEGPFYMFEALHAQVEGDGYNYGYHTKETGEGGQQALIAANGDFTQFNQEQQAKIIEHYYVRRFMKNWAPTNINPDTGQPQPSYEEWQPYANIVHG